MNQYKKLKDELYDYLYEERERKRDGVSYNGDKIDVMMYLVEVSGLAEDYKNYEADRHRIENEVS